MRGGVAWLLFPMRGCFEQVCDKTVELLFSSLFNFWVEPGHELSCFLQPSTVGYNNFLSVSLPRLFPPERRLECPSDHDRTTACSPCLMVLLSSRLLTFLPTAESITVFANLFVILSTPRSIENLFSAVSNCAHHWPTLRFRFPIEGRGGEDGGVIAICKPFWVRYSAISS